MTLSVNYYLVTTSCSTVHLLNLLFEISMLSEGLCLLFNFNLRSSFSGSGFGLLASKRFNGFGKNLFLDLLAVWYWVFVFGLRSQGFLFPTPVRGIGIRCKLLEFEFSVSFGIRCELWNLLWALEFRVSRILEFRMSFWNTLWAFWIQCAILEFGVHLRATVLFFNVTLLETVLLWWNDSNSLKKVSNFMNQSYAILTH